MEYVEENILDNCWVDQKGIKKNIGIKLNIGKENSWIRV